jgi:phosphonate transport system substrate-binding protein
MVKAILIFKSLTGWLLLLGLMLILGSGCASNSPTSTPTVTSAPSLPRDQIIVLGDIDAYEPLKKVKRFGPLARYLAENLTEFGVRKGEVIIARDVPDMGLYLKEGKIDFFFDSSFPTLAVRRLADSQIILRRWKGGASDYWATYLVRRDSGIDRVEGLAGKVVAFEEPYSTSGFILPAGTLIENGFHLRQVNSPDEAVGPNEIGYVFSLDEENTIEMVLDGRVAAGGVANLDYNELPAELMNQLEIFGQTITVPRQLVSARPGLEPALVDKVEALLIGLEQTDRGRKILEDLQGTSRFDRISEESQVALGELEELMQLVAKE